MARPKKLSTAEMLHIVETYFETHGDPGKLKCSFLEEYATSIGIDVKAYDFRRNEAVRKRMEELRSTGRDDCIQAIAYKGMDVDAFLNRNRTKERLRSSLLELDETWRRVYERAASLTKHNTALLSDMAAKNRETEALTSRNMDLETTSKTLSTSSNALMLENRYLKRMLKQYLYPAVANEILKNESVLEQVDTEVTQAAMYDLSEPVVPASFSQSVSADAAMLSREESLLSRMREPFVGDNDDSENLRIEGMNPNATKT